MIAGAMPNKNKVRVVVFLDRTFYSEVGEIAKSEGVSRSKIIRNFLNR
jgi:metal-responsive CopG/Arc/MetJ family transcriptional regulator